MGPNLAFVIADETWRHGPLFEIHIWLRSRSLAALEQSDAQRVLDLLRIDGPYQSVSQLGRTDLRKTEWRTAEVSLGVWHLSDDCIVGVKISSVPGYRSGIFLGVPPEHMERAVERFPWDVRGPWVTERVVKCHIAIVDAIRRLHEEYPLQAASIREEGWSFWLDERTEGILVHRVVAAKADLRGEAMEDAIVIDL